MKSVGVISHQAFLLFTFLGVLFIPFSFQNWSWQSKLTAFLFEDLILLLGSCFEWISISNQEISSDSTTLYLLVVILLFAAIVLAISLSFFNFWKQQQRRIFNILQLILAYYLVLILLKYGFDKIFKAQFYLPEPNTLYTPLGMLDKDILFWSTMGTSHAYNVFMGLLEVIPALMILYRRTRILGLFILFGVLINVVFINFCFDISVKLFSTFLLLINLLLLAPSFKKIIQFFVLNKPVSLPHLTGNGLIASTTIRLSLKTIIILIFLTESLLPYINSGYYNDDTIPRNHLHGAYEILSPDTTSNNLINLNLKRFFIHRRNYLIFQYDDDTLEDFRLEINPTKNQFILTNYQGETMLLTYKYSAITERLQLKSEDVGWVIDSKVLPWKDLPLMQPLFHWTVDGIH